jgi:diacylglycerol kinase (ATP)
MARLWRAWLSSVAGLAWAARHECAFQQELAVLAVALPASFLLADGAWQRSVLIASVLLIVLVEAVNTAIERLSDHVSPGHDPMIKVVKDLGSAAVLIAIAIAGTFWLAALMARFV